MPRVNILNYPDERLRRSAPPVVDFGSETQAMVDDMFDTLYASESCAGLSATQLDFESPLHITVIDCSEGRNKPLCLINAKITKTKDSYTGEEGCMSVAGDICARITRPAQIWVEAQDRYGYPLAFHAKGFLAKCIQHELDHLQGRLFIDYLSSGKQSMIAARVRTAHKKKLTLRWTVLWSMVAAFVGALLPCAGIPALAVYLIPLVPAIASLGLVAMAAINAVLFCFGVLVLGVLIAISNGLFTLLQGSETLRHPTANNLFDYVLISLGTAIIKTVGFVRIGVKQVSAVSDHMLIMALKNKFWTAVGLCIVGLFFASTFTPIGGPIALLAGITPGFTPVVNFLMNGFIGLGLVLLGALAMAVRNQLCKPDENPLLVGPESETPVQAPSRLFSFRVWRGCPCISQQTFASLDIPEESSEWVIEDPDLSNN